MNSCITDLRNSGCLDVTYDMRVNVKQYFYLQVTIWLYTL